MTSQMIELARAMDAAFKFKVGDVVEGKVAVTVAAPAEKRVWISEVHPDVRAIIIERVAIQCEQGVQPSYRCTGWRRDGCRLQGIVSIAECELRLSGPFAQPAQEPAPRGKE